ncbi:hypothetical protein IFM89_021130 [Coptis chinensis]|uniref:Uncharacterized protein n=1 Tax=Coptis chinensis TaxID=261450 RepID=A0A835LYY9_9MAGN|nr:hypothetical protein IFM89_021130 [Coptis chinensis]
MLATFFRMLEGFANNKDLHKGIVDKVEDMRPRGLLQHGENIVKHLSIAAAQHEEVLWFLIVNHLCVYVRASRNVAPRSITMCDTSGLGHNLKARLYNKGEGDCWKALLQLKSCTKHKLLANHVGPRVSVACILNPCFDMATKPFGPIKELISDESGPVYREITMNEYLAQFFSQGLDGKCMSNFKL